MNNSTEATLNRPFATDRRDAWWVGPLLTALGLGGFGVYATFRAITGYPDSHQWGPYLSPLFSPLIEIPGFGLSPAFLILWAPGGFRATCYYYRKAYYRAFFQHPTACGVSEMWKHDYKGETSFPFILQNVHRFFAYIAVLFIFILAYDSFLGLRWDDGQGGKTWGLGLGTLIMFANTALLGSYTFGCHSLRHVAGGKIDCFSCTAAGRAQHGLWKIVSWFNQRHMLFAWCSLFSVGFTDFYIWMCARGTFTDLRVF